MRKVSQIHFKYVFKLYGSLFALLELRSDIFAKSAYFRIRFAPALLNLKSYQFMIFHQFQ